MDPLTDLEPDARAVVTDEVEMAARVGRRIAFSLAQAELPSNKIQRVRHDQELVALRDQIGEARAEDVPALLAAMIQTANVMRVDQPKVTGNIDPATPYFGHLRLQENGRPRDVLIGKRGMVDREAGVVIVDWRNAPVSRIYYRYDEGDEYEEEFGDKTREGQLLVRRTVTFREGHLVRVKSPAGTFIKKGNDDKAPWVALAAREAPELRGGVGKAERAPVVQSRGRLGFQGEAHLRPDKHLPEIAALIDSAQFDAMTQSDSGVVILQGGAGSGKTTVALHRVAYLVYENPQQFRPAHILVVVAQPALARYVERLLPALDVGGVRAFAYSDWVQQALERVLPKHDRRKLLDPPGEIARLKKHPKILDAVTAQVVRRGHEVIESLTRAVDGRPGGDDVLALWHALPPADPLVPRVLALLDGLKGARSIPDDTRERARRSLEASRERITDLLGEWEELITDEGLLAACELDRVSFESAMRYTKRQVEEPEDLSHVDPDARTPIDDNETDPDDPCQALDPHDGPLLLNMCIARMGAIVTPGGKPIAYDHVVVDEAQDLSAVEIRPLLVATGQRRSLTLAGDVVQKVVFDNGFNDWPMLIEQLQTTALQVEPLKLTYRSTAEVVAFARDVLGPLAPVEPPKAVRQGAPVEAFAFADPGEEIAFLAENLRALMAREPQANVAVLTRYPERARFYATMLQDAEVPRLRLVAGSDFAFSPGIDVTTVARVKGLEYDYVVLAEVTEAMYPDHNVARHLLHIGATRAAHQLWITTSTETPSPLLPLPLLENGLL